MHCYVQFNITPVLSHLFHIKNQTDFIIKFNPFQPVYIDPTLGSPAKRFRDPLILVALHE